MKTVTSYYDVHNMTPIGLPTFSIISQDKTVVTEIQDTDLDSYSITDECFSITTTIFKYINNPEWETTVEIPYDITLTQRFIDADGNVVELQKEYKNRYLDGNNSFGSSSTRNVTYGYYFYDEKMHERMKIEE